jgi:hypothetical protein
MGELAMRTAANYSRLESHRYWPETIFEMDQLAWPADWEGRTMLALTMHAQATGREPAFLDQILDAIPGRLNTHGYLGPIYNKGVTHEQAMSGHSWMIRALVEYFYWKKKSDPARAALAKSILEGIVDGLYLPQTENYANYPMDEDTRYSDSRWHLSGNIDPNWAAAGEKKQAKHGPGESDCGCAFIAIDGATAAYELLGRSSLVPLIENMIASYNKLPLEEIYAQTHATLSALRGILRFYRLTGNKKHLKVVVDVFQIYKRKAWTDHYANYNWFGLPRWTEPCAVVDSFLVAQELWEITEDEAYLQDAHHIFYNAIAHAQRSNGAFGTDLCCGAKIGVAKKEGTEGWSKSEEGILFAKALTYEVFWCCNMRGGDGLSRAAMYSFYEEGNTVTVPYFHNCRAELNLLDGKVFLREEANYPFSGNVRFFVEKSSAPRLTLRLFAPQTWTSGAASKLLINGKSLKTNYKNGFLCATFKPSAGDEIVLETAIKFKVAKGSGCADNVKEHHSFRHGPMILGVLTRLESEDQEATSIQLQQTPAKKYLGAARYEVQCPGGASVLLQPMWGKENLTEPLDVYQILFAKS